MEISGKVTLWIPVPPSKTRIQPSSCTVTQEVFPPYKEVSGPEMGIEPLTPLIEIFINL
jgi:hypothetical protein